MRSPRAEEIAGRALKTRKAAKSKGITGTQLGIAWALLKSDTIVPVIGARRRRQLEKSLRARDVVLTPDDVAAIEHAFRRRWSQEPATMKTV